MADISGQGVMLQPPLKTPAEVCKLAQKKNRTTTTKNTLRCRMLIYFASIRENVKINIQIYFRLYRKMQKYLRIQESVSAPNLDFASNP